MDYLVVDNEFGVKQYFELERISKVEYGKLGDFLLPEDIIGNQERKNESAFQITFKSGKTSTYGAGWIIKFEKEEE